MTVGCPYVSAKASVMWMKQLSVVEQRDFGVLSRRRVWQSRVRLQRTRNRGYFVCKLPFVCYNLLTINRPRSCDARKSHNQDEAHPYSLHPSHGAKANLCR